MPIIAKMAPMRRVFGGLLLAMLMACFAAPSMALAGTKVVIKGGGFGHGMGLSQYGAYGYARHGKSASFIVHHYYSHTNIDSQKAGSIRVGLLPLYGSAQSQVSLSSSTDPYAADGGKIVFRVPGRKTRVARGNKGSSFVIQSSSTGGMRVYKNGSLVKDGGVSVFGVKKRKMVLTYQQYGSIVDVAAKNLTYAYGHMDIETYPSSSCSNGYCMRLVAVMPMQKYLYGLGEMPASWPQAALKAQVMAARTYALAKLETSQHRYPCDCALYDSSIDQVYSGDIKRHQAYWSNWKQAVDDSKNKVILHKGQLIDALYSASSGGHTENNENVWGGTPIPYLRGVPDPYDDNAANPYHSWKVRMGWSHFASLIGSAYGVGTVQKVVLKKPFGVSGRVIMPKIVDGHLRGGANIVGSSATKRVSGWSLHSVLGLRDTLFRIALRYTVGSNLRPHYQALNGAPGDATGPVRDVPHRTKQREGEAQNFKHGRMTWRSKTDRAVWQHGPVLSEYTELNRERSRLGMPTSDVWDVGGRQGASYVNGIIVWSKSHGGWPILKSFRIGYRKVDGVDGPLGVPLGAKHGGGNLPHGGAKQSFAHGDLYLNPHLHEAFALWGGIADKYAKIGRARSACGYPVARQRHTSLGTRAVFGHGVISNHAGDVHVHC